MYYLRVHILIGTSDRLLDLLSLILCGQLYKPLGAPPSLTRGDISTITRDLSATQVSHACDSYSY